MISRFSSKLTPSQLNVLRIMAAEGSLTQVGQSYRTGTTEKPLLRAASSMRVLWRHALCVQRAYGVHRWWTLTNKGWETLANDGVIPDGSTENDPT